MQAICYAQRMPVLVKNKKIHFDYELLETFEAGAVLFGFEVKSLRAGLGKLDGARVVVRGNEAFLVGATIPAIQPKNAPKDYDPERPRRLLLTRKEIDSLLSIESVKGLTIAPISWYTNKRRVKLSFCQPADKRIIVMSSRISH